MSEVSIYVIILSYNNYYDTKTTIESFLRQKVKLSIVVIDNNSNDNSLEKLRADFNYAVTFIKNNRNLGYTGGNNVGLKYALQNNAEYIIISNNDVEFYDPDIITKLIRILNRSKKIGILGVCQKSNSESEVEKIGGKLFPKSRYSFNIYRGVHELPENVVDVDYVVGFFMLIKKEVLNNIGYFDDDFYLYGEDSEFGLRAWRAGYLCAVCKSITIIHKGAVSTKEDSPLKHYYQTRNLYLLIKKTKLNHKYSFYFYTIFLKSIMRRILKILLIKSRYSKADRLLAVMLGVWHLVTNKRGYGFKI